MTCEQYITLEEVLDQIELPISNVSATVTPTKGFEDENHVFPSTDLPSTSSSISTHANIDVATIADPVAADFQSEISSVNINNDDYFFSSSEEDVTDDTQIIVMDLVEDNQVDKEASTNKKPHIGNKEHACCYCNKVMKNLARHFQHVHSEELEVAKLLTIERKSQTRRNGFIELARRGDYYHNMNVLATEKGSLILVRQPTKKDGFKSYSYRNYGPCPDCLGFMLKKHLWLHKKTNCPKVNTSATGNRKILDESNALFSSLMMESKNISKEFTTTVFDQLRKDTNFLVIEKDDTILKFGLLKWEKFGAPQKELIRQTMRQLARLVIELRKLHQKPNTYLKDWLKPEHFDDIVQAVRVLCKLDIGNSTSGRPLFNKSSLALKLGHHLKQCIGIERGQVRRTNDLEKDKPLVNLLTLMELEWSNKLALQTLYENKINSVQLLPVTEDLVKLNKFLNKEINEITSNEEIQGRDWTRLASLILCRLVLFNKRRSGETSKITTVQYSNIPDYTKIGTEEMKKTLSEVEKQLFKSLPVLEIIGTRNNKVPVLFTPDMIKAIDVLIANREKAGIPDTNPYLFARRNSDRFLRGHTCLQQFASEAQLAAPALVNATQLRKYIATVCQVFNLTKTESDWLARHLGLDIRVHREFYRAQESTIEMTKISQLLLAVEQGHAHKFAGKSLKEIELTDIDALDNDPNMTLGAGTSGLQASSPTDQVPVSELDESNTCSGELESYHEQQDKKKNRMGARISQKKGCKLDEPYSFSDEDESDLEEPVKKRKKKVGSNISRKKAADKRPWSVEEKGAVLSFFQDSIRRHIVPRKEECEKCKEGSEALFNRSWKDVKNCVHNYIKKLKKGIHL